MQVNTFDILGIIAYFVLVGVFAFLTRRTKTFAEFSVGNRKVPATMIFASLAATYIGPGFSVGFTGKGFSTGYLFYFLVIPYAIQTIVMGLVFAPRLSRFKDCHTIGDVMKYKYDKFTHLLSGIVSVGLCIGFTAIMGKIAGSLLHSVTGMGLTLSIAIVTMFTALYTFTGGIRAVIATDALQFAWFSLMVPIVLLIAVFKAPAGDIGATAATITRSGFDGMTGLQLIGVAISFLLGETLIPPYANRALAARSEEASKTGFVLAGAYSLVWLFICATIGIYAHQYLPVGTAADDVFLGMGKMLLPYGTFGLLLAAVIAIVMSSQESVLNAATVSFVRDIVGINTQLTDRSALIVSRIGTLVIAAIATIVALYSPSIIDGLLICYSIWAPALLLPLLLGLYLGKTVPAAGWLSIICGGTTSILWQTVLKEPKGIPAILVGLAASALAYGIAHGLGRVKEQEA